MISKIYLQIKTTVAFFQKLGPVLIFFKCIVRFVIFNVASCKVMWRGITDYTGFIILLMDLNSWRCKGLGMKNCFFLQKKISQNSTDWIGMDSIRQIFFCGANKKTKNKKQKTGWPLTLKFSKNLGEIFSDHPPPITTSHPITIVSSGNKN